MFVALLAIAVAQAATPPAVQITRPFEGLEFLLNHCWRGELRPGVQDTHCFERAYDGRFVRDRHDVTGGYAGETLYNWNGSARQAEYTYWSSAGFVSRGTMRYRRGTLEFGDEVARGPDGREVRIATTWRQVDSDSYEVRSGSAANPAGARVVRYRRVAAAPIAVEEQVSADGTRTLTHEMLVPAPVDQVYAAFASPAGWRSWAVPHAWASPADPDLMETSYTPTATAGDPRNIAQRFLLRVPNRLVAFRTVQTPPGFPHAAEFRRVTSVALFDPVDGGTRVRLTGAGYPAGAAGDTLLRFFHDGNRTSLEQLRTRFVSGPIDWAARAAAQRR